MQAGLAVSVVYSDEHLLEIEIRAWNERFAGSTRVYTGLKELSEFEAVIAGFPLQVPDERRYEFGSRGQGDARGYCGLRFHTTGSGGRAVLEVDIDDNDSDSSARFSIPVEAVAIDRFVPKLLALEAARSGTVTLGELD